jgi:hypothetical protein
MFGSSTSCGRRPPCALFVNSSDLGSIGGAEARKIERRLEFVRSGGGSYPKSGGIGGVRLCRICWEHRVRPADERVDRLASQVALWDVIVLVWVEWDNDDEDTGLQSGGLLRASSTLPR